MALEHIIQTRIPIETAGQVEQIAAKEGLAVATWLRRLIIKEVNSMYIQAWVAQKGERPNVEAPCYYYLKRFKDFSAEEMEIVLLYGKGNEKAGTPVTSGYLSTTGWYKDQDNYRFYLDDSPKPWSIVRAP